jgi:hypothetical protein
MVNKPTIPLRISSGSLSGTRIVVKSNDDGTVSYCGVNGSNRTISMPVVTQPKYAQGNSQAFNSK